MFFVGSAFVTAEVYSSKCSPNTPLQLGAWESRLGGYDERDVVLEGIASGFRLGVTQPDVPRAAAGSKLDEVVRKKLDSELESGRILGPFAVPPVADLQISPVMTVEKKEKGKFRMIHNLSAPYGRSVNDAIPGDVKSVSYCRLTDVVDLILRTGGGHFMSKTDIKDAFRICPIHRDDWKWLGMKVGNSYLVDTVLPMGCGSSCAVFQTLTRAICWMAEREMPGLQIFGYLDDFLLCSKDFQSAERHLSAFKDLCVQLGVPLAGDKTEGPSRQMVFLGIGIDTVRCELYLHEERRESAIKKLRAFVRKRSAMRKEWQSLVGTLSFLSSVVLPGKAFMSRVSERLKSDKRWIANDAMVKLDLKSWVSFIEGGMFRPFKMMDSLAVPKHHIFTDASGSLGYGAWYTSRWFYGCWDSDWWCRQNIMLLELYPIWVALQLWSDHLKDSCILVHTDNQALVAVLMSRRTNLRPANAMLRDISLQCMVHNILMRVEYISSGENYLADALSRLQVEEFLQRSRGFVEGRPETVPEGLQQRSCRAMLEEF